MAPSIGIVDNPLYKEHRGPTNHPESPQRLLAVSSVLEEFQELLTPIAPRPVEDEELLLVHDRNHLHALEKIQGKAPCAIDGDTYIGSRSLEVARLAAGGAIEISNAVAKGKVSTGFAALRPPGHHAEAGQAMGFCLFNNVAIATRYLQKTGHAERVLVLDWDVHHGNGTQHIFEEDPTVLYFSTHQYPLYPGTGAASECGANRGLGATINVPMPAGCGDEEYVGVFQRLLVPAALAFRPDIVLVSCGFDAHLDDPLASMKLTQAGFSSMTNIARALSNELCGGRLVFFLEGGYAQTGLRDGTKAVISASIQKNVESIPKGIPAPKGSRLAAILEPVVSLHRPRIPEMGLA